MGASRALGSGVRARRVGQRRQVGASGEARLSTMDLGASLRLFHLGAWRVRGIVLFFRGFLDFIASCFCCTQISLSSFFFYYYSKKFHRKFAHCTQTIPAHSWSLPRARAVGTFSSTPWTRSLQVLYCMTGRHGRARVQSLSLCVGRKVQTATKMWRGFSRPPAALVYVTRF